MDMDYELVLEDEFDALCVDVMGDEVSSKVKYPAKLHARKVVRQMGVDEGLIYLPGRPETSLEDADQPQHFRQRRYFFYLSGADFEDCAVTYEIGHDKLILWIPYVEPRQILWFGKKPTPAECMRRYDVDEVRYTTQLSKFLRSHAGSSASPLMYVLHPDQAPDLGSGGGARARPHVRIDHERLKPAMDCSRLVKTPYEIAMIRRANDVSSAAHRAVAERILKLRNERQIEAIIQSVCIANGTREQAYPVIAGSGANGSTLHYGSNDAPLAGKQTVVLDAGCEWNCYASDITRTLPLSGSWTPRAAAIHAIVQRMQEECIAGVRPGKIFYELHLHAASVAIDGLLKLGILKGSRDDIARAGTIAAFFPHGLGHHVGLDVHDMAGSIPLAVMATGAGAGIQLEDGKRVMVTPAMLNEMERMRGQVNGWASAAGDRPELEPGMIVTVEPGIYFCREYLEGYFRNDPTHSRFIDWDAVEGYYPVGGVRIEDCVLVTKDGNENLTTAPKGDELLEVINKGRK